MGLIDHWDVLLRPLPIKCRPIFETNSKKSKKTDKLTPLSLKNLTGAFLVLLVGMLLSLFSFLCEKISVVFKPNTKQRS